jgi:hypothetical protein
VPQMLLIKAKRFQAKRDAEGAAQLLIKNHVPDEMAHMIACGLMEQGEFYSAVLADQAGNTRSLCVIVPKNMALAYAPAVVDFQTCVRFTQIAQSEFETQMRAIQDAFTAEEKQL